MTRIEIKNKVINILTEALYIYGSKVTEYDHVFEDYKADEDEVNEIVNMLKTEFNIDFTQDELLRFGKMSLREVVDTIAKKVI